MKLYVASSWRNRWQPEVVAHLRWAGHEVYDFRHPKPGDDGFAWSSIDERWQEWTPDIYRDVLDHSVARAGFALDMEALDWADGCVLVLPCGRSAHLELGYAVGQGKRTAILLNPSGFEPELMYRMVDSLCVNVPELLRSVAAWTVVQAVERRQAAGVCDDPGCLHYDHPMSQNVERATSQ